VAIIHLKEKVIVIIGGTSGIGLAAAEACIESGARVVAVGYDDEGVADARTRLGDHALVMQGDARDAGCAELAIKQACSQFEGCHALYHVAGGSGRKFGDGPLHEITDEGWRETLRLNLDSVFYSNRAAINHFLNEGSGGTIVNLASVLGFSPAPTHFSTHAYATAKAGIIGMTKSAAAHYAPKNIRVNAIAPGLVDTPMATRAAQNPEIMEYIKTKQPLDGGRIAFPDDLAASAVFLLSDAARFITGQVLAVDGGWSVSEGQTQ
jgi:NAD(P)-dependent dehydrogenase (short-subunit alcohol dehydrogenase family)